MRQKSLAASKTVGYHQQHLLLNLSPQAMATNAVTRLLSPL
jgi:hypothetical protein